MLKSMESVVPLCTPLFCVALASGDASSVIAFCLPRVADRFFLEELGI